MLQSMFAYTVSYLFYYYILSRAMFIGFFSIVVDSKYVLIQNLTYD